MYLSKQKKAGFTLTELLVVLAIISVLSGIVLFNVNVARNKGKNARAVADVSQYLTGLALARESRATKDYPPTGGNRVCLGTGATCRWGGGSFTSSSSVNNALTLVMSSLPSSDYRVGNYQGYSYQSDGTGYTINWFLYGLNRNCELGSGTNDAPNNITRCTYTTYTP
jgi:prepilin-type N-terminal cleavage/methylation domain-containing protein